MPTKTGNAFAWPWKKGVSKIDQYVLVEFISPFIGGIVFFTFIFLMFQALRLAELLIIKGVTLTIIGKIVTYNVMQFLPFTIPVAFLMAVLVSFGRMSADSEIVAMKATGISLRRLTLPILFCSIVVASFSLFLNLDWVPLSNSKLKALLVKANNTKIATALQEGTFTSGFYDILIYAGKLQSDTGKMKHVFIYDERKPNFPFVMIAKEGELLKIETENELGSEVGLRLFNGSIHRIYNSQEGNTQKQEHQRYDFSEEISYLQITEGSDSFATKPKSMTFTQLQKARSKEGATPHFRRQIDNEIHGRFSQALSTLFFTFLGIGFGVSRSRSNRASAVLVTLLSIVVFYSLKVLGSELAVSGSLPAVLAAHLPNLVFLGVGLWIYRKANW